MTNGHQILVHVNGDYKFTIANNQRKLFSGGLNTSRTNMYNKMK